MVLYYIHDPMCSWCWAFRPTLQTLLESLPDTIEPSRLLGGLAADNDQPMAEPMRRQIRDTWRHIQQSVPGTGFNFDFWQVCMPRRSTYRACRAVLLARQAGLDDAMTLAIQQAYYLRARNPSDTDTLVALAAGLGLNSARFAAELDSATTREALEREIADSRALGVSSFPSLVLDSGSERWPIAIDYNRAGTMLDSIEAVITD